MTGPAEIVVVTNRKGGTGKTTTSVNLAAEFAAQGWRVLLIDMDTQGQGRLLSGIRTDIKLAESFAHRQPVRT